MPEGPEIAVTTERLDKILNGAKLVSFKVVSGKYLSDKIKNIELIDNLILKEVNSKGKFIYFHFKNDEDTFEKRRISDEDVYMFNTLGLTGAWSLKKDKYTKIEMRFKGDFHPLKTRKLNKVDGDLYLPIENLSFDAFEKELTIYFNDKLSFGTVMFAKSQISLEKKLKTLGPDVLKDGVSLADFKGLITKYKKMNIVEWLMSQKILSGIGNYLAPEILYRAKISPMHKISDLTNQQIKKLYYYVRRVPKMAYITQGGFKKYLPSVKVAGNFHFCVYSRKECPHGHPIKKSKIIGTRTTYWCPNEQI